MLTRLNLTRNPYVPAMFLCAVAFVLLNASVFAVDTTNDRTMTVLSMEEMEHLAGGPYRSPKDVPATSAYCGSLCGFCSYDAYYTFKTCFCNGPSTVPYCMEVENGAGWSRYRCGCSLWSCSTKFFMGKGGTRYKCVTS